MPLYSSTSHRNGGYKHLISCNIYICCFVLVSYLHTMSLFLFYLMHFRKVNSMDFCNSFQYSSLPAFYITCFHLVLQLSALNSMAISESPPVCFHLYGF